MPKVQVHMKGIDDASKKLNKFIKKIPNITLPGLIKCAIILQRSMDKESPTVPADTRNLQSSFFIVTTKSVAEGGSPKFEGDDAGQMASNHTRTIQSGKSKVETSRFPMIMLGFSANYAEWMHEKMDIKHYTRAGSGAKFFESAIARNTQKMLAVLTKEVKEGIKNE